MTKLFLNITKLNINTEGFNTNDRDADKALLRVGDKHDCIGIRYDII